MVRIPSSYDIVGDAIVVELPEGIPKKEEMLVAKELMKRHKHVTRVFKKTSKRIGVFRTRKLKLIAGENKSIVLHKENRCLFKLNLRRVYYSPREQSERLRVVEALNRYKNFYETVMVFFAGIGCYPILISKRCNVRRVVGIEINPVAVKYFRENIELNKTKNCEAVLGDVAEVAGKFYDTCDAVIMPYPEGGYKFLDHALRCLKNNGVCLFYAIGEEKNPFGEWKRLIENTAEKHGCEVEFLHEEEVLPYAPRKWKVRIDFKVTRK